MAAWLLRQREKKLGFCEGRKFDMEDYMKKMPIQLSLGTGIIMGMFFLYNKRVITEVFHIIFLSSFVLYIVGRYLRDNIVSIYNDYLEKKNYENNIADKEGNLENISNNVSESNETQSRLDLKAEEKEDDFVGLTENIAKE